MRGLHVLPEVRRVETLQITAQRGAEGNPKNPLRWVWLYYSLDGELLACYDPINGPADAFNAPAAPSESEYHRARSLREEATRPQRPSRPPSWRA